MTLVLVPAVSITPTPLVSYKNDEVFRSGEPHHFVTLLFCAIFMLRE